VSAYADIHAHVLPGIDDGPRDLEGTIRMLRAAASSGIATIAATPHLRSDFPDVHPHELQARGEEVRAAIAREEIPVRLAAGAEVSVSWALEASPEDLRLATYEHRGTDLLVETPTTDYGALNRILHELRAQRLRVVLAHPERSAEFQQSLSQLTELVAQGVLLQVNADSLLDTRRGSPVGRVARELCQRGLAHILASDGHRGESWRPVTVLGPAVKVLAGMVGEDRARWMTCDAPLAVLDGTELPEAPPVAGRSRASRLLGRR
jgi:protein-tyrosine phosphatase